MSVITLCAALIAVLFGLATAFQAKTPLFYKIVVYGFCCYLLSAVYDALFFLFFGCVTVFHAGYLGYAGTFFFLFSSYFGALDRLADGHEPRYRNYRLAAFAPSAAILILSILAVRRVALVLILIPVAATAYYACKHLILPDVEMGIIRVMRPYNALILLFCLIQPFAVCGLLQSANVSLFVVIVNGILVAAAVPVARIGVRKWFM